jgi:hypothetical protein
VSPSSIPWAPSWESFPAKWRMLGGAILKGGEALAKRARLAIWHCAEHGDDDAAAPQVQRRALGQL